MSAQQTESILVVEDDEGVGYLQSLALRRGGFDVTVVSSAEEALLTLAERRFDLALLDFRLPGIGTGLDLYDQMKSAGHDVPVIFVTGYSDENTVIKALRAGASDFVTKGSEYLEYLPEAAERVLRQKRLEKQLEDSQARFRSFIDNGPAVILVKDGEGRISYANKRYESLFPNFDWHNKTEEEVLPGSRNQDLLDGDQTVITTGCLTQRIDGLTMPNGQSGHWITYTFPIDGTLDSSLSGIVAVDITDRTLAEKALRESETQLRQSQKMEAVGTLAGGVAHEFNNLLQAIQGYTLYAMEGLDEDDERRQDLKQVLKASDRAATLTRQLLGFSRREILQLADLDPNDQVRDLVKLLRPLIGENIQIEMILSDQVGVVHADAGHLQQLLMNLCVNARDAMPQGVKLLIKTENLTLDDELCELQRDIEPGRYLVLSVADNGSGIAPEVKDRIFEPFFTTKGVGKGTGLGLPMVYGVVRQHKGTIRVYSEVGLGTTFRIYLPTVDHAVDSSHDTTHQKSRGGSETILVAEDDPMVRDVAVRILERAGYHTITARDGEEAVELFEQHRDEISLAVLDMVMPRLGGREVSQRIKTSKPEMQIVYCSGYDPEMSGDACLPDDVSRVVLKPFEPEKLLNIIRHALDESLCLVN